MSRYGGNVGCILSTESTTTSSAKERREKSKTNIKSLETLDGYSTALLISFPRVSVRQQAGNGVHPGSAHGSADGLVPRSIWLSPQTMVASKSIFTCKYKQHMRFSWSVMPNVLRVHHRTQCSQEFMQSCCGTCWFT